MEQIINGTAPKVVDIIKDESVYMKYLLGLILWLDGLRFKAMLIFWLRKAVKKHEQGRDIKLEEKKIKNLIGKILLSKQFETLIAKNWLMELWKAAQLA